MTVIQGSPVAANVRSVDLGFGGLIEKFEEHLGKLATRILLIIIYGLIVAWLARTAISAVVAAEAMIADENDLAAVLGYGLRILLAAVVWLVCAAFLRWQHQRLMGRSNELLQKAETAVAHQKEVLDKRIQSLRELLTEAFPDDDDDHGQASGC